MAAKQPGTPFLEHLVDLGRLDAVQCERVIALRRERGESESLIATRLGMVGERDMAELLSDFLGVPLARPEDYPPQPVPAGGLTPDFMARARAVPLGRGSDGLALAMVDPADTFTVRAVGLAAGQPVRPWAAVPSELAQALERLYGVGARAGDGTGRAAAAEDLRRLTDSASEEPVIRYVNGLIGSAVLAGASDIHIESSADRVVQRLRIDGVLSDIAPPPAGFHDNVVSRLKVMAGLNIAQRRLPQDGRFRTVAEGREIDLRISIVPTLHGESVVLRLLDRAHAPLDLTRLGLNAVLRDQLTRLLHLPSGMLLVTGPTGSGKTSTLYAALQQMNTRERKILTIEDPVEYQLPGINQIPVRPEIGLTFADLLRRLLRHDPDILLVGEIRDLETASVAAHASLTGRLLLSTVHTNDAVTTVTRLLEIGLEAYLLAAVLRGIMAQRLVRCLCLACREAYRPDPALLETSGLAAVAPPDLVLHRPRGCPECRGTGYRGRTAIAELVVFDEPLRRAVAAGADAGELLAAARSGGMVDLRTDGLGRVMAGVTSLEEVLRVAGAADLEADRRA